MSKVSWKPDAELYTEIDLRQDLEFLEKEYNRRVLFAKQNWVKHNREFDRDDYIFNVTGIIKVESIFSREVVNSLDIVYEGTVYRWLKGGYITPSNSKEKRRI